MDKCALGLAECPPNADCVSNDASFSCVCRPGFTGPDCRKQESNTNTRAGRRDVQADMQTHTHTIVHSLVIPLVCLQPSGHQRLCVCMVQIACVMVHGALRNTLW